MAVLQKCICQQANTYMQSLASPSIEAAAVPRSQTCQTACMTGKPHALAQRAAPSLLTDPDVLRCHLMPCNRCGTRAKLSKGFEQKRQKTVYYKASRGSGDRMGSVLQVRLEP